MVAPAGMPDDVYNKIVEAVKKVQANPEYLQKMKDVGLATSDMAGAEFAKYIEGLAADLESMRSLFGW